MARIRSVHPGLFTDEGFVSCSPFARLLAIGIWTESDDQGVFEWKPVGLKMRILPVDNVDLNALLAELEANNLVARFSSGGKQYGAVRNFRRYQKPKKPNSIHPLPSSFRTYVALDDTSSELMDDETGVSSEPEPVKQTSVQKNGEIQFQMEEGGGRVGESPPLSPPHADPPGDATASPREVLRREKFEELRSIFPRRDGGHPLKPAEKAWNAAMRAKIDPDQIISAAKRYGEEQRRKGKIGTEFVKSLGPWLNLREFGDPPDSLGSSTETRADQPEMVQMLNGKRMLRSLIDKAIEDWKRDRSTWNESWYGFPPDWPSCPVLDHVLAAHGLERAKLREVPA